jgi:hypothetical protein
VSGRRVPALFKDGTESIGVKSALKARFQGKAECDESASTIVPGIEAWTPRCGAYLVVPIHGWKLARMPPEAADGLIAQGVSISRYDDEKKQHTDACQHVEIHGCTFPYE